ncbi:hypothetical protein CLIB1423_10S02124 [[Candida] railenensis]|uniref:Hap4 transcription factor heteromerisation domain-containing protein n=1 Tax=[Candida] railenensis TaxID=45579 RepID=A0A9P0QR04_9ASCO|nr:hypothetical protein CLIB1423_10S02124 [[Candida] railenensis]
MSQSQSTCPLTVKTSKAWVLPPRPKPGRKPTTSQASGAVCQKEKKSKCKKETKPKPTQSVGSVNSVNASQCISPNVISCVNATTSMGATGAKTNATASPAATSPQAGNTSVKVISSNSGMQATLNKSISSIESENSVLKDHLLSLIHDYKHLRNAVLSETNSESHHHLIQDDSVHTARKRSFTELHTTSDPMVELIDNMNDLSHNPPTLLLHNFLENDLRNLPLVERDEEEDVGDDQDFLNFINLDNDDIEDDDHHEEEEEDSPFLSRTTSPSETDGEQSLMTSLTRSTTVSTNNSSFLLTEPRSKSQNIIGASSFSMFKEQPYNFYNLPNYNEMESEDSSHITGFTFDKLSPNEKFHSILKQDQYNMVTDFLEEKLIDNDMNYYVQTQQDLS